MKDVIQLTGNVNELGHIMVVEFKFLQLEKVLDIPEITRDEVIHRNHLVTFLNKPVAQMGS